MHFDAERSGDPRSGDSAKPDVMREFAPADSSRSTSGHASMSVDDVGDPQHPGTNFTQAAIVIFTASYRLHEVSNLITRAGSAFTPRSRSCDFLILRLLDPTTHLSFGSSNSACHRNAIDNFHVSLPCRLSKMETYAVLLYRHCGLSRGRIRPLAIQAHPHEHEQAPYRHPLLRFPRPDRSRYPRKSLVEARRATFLKTRKRALIRLTKMLLNHIQSCNNQRHSSNYR